MHTHGKRFGKGAHYKRSKLECYRAHSEVYIMGRWRVGFNESRKERERLVIFVIICLVWRKVLEGTVRAVFEKESYPSQRGSDRCCFGASLICVF